MNPAMKLTLMEPRTPSQAWYRTADGRFDVLGEDLNTNRYRAMGAGAVWLWQVAQPTHEWAPKVHAFATKQDCLDDLARTHYGHPTLSTPPAATPTTRRHQQTPATTRINWSDYE